MVLLYIYIYIWVDYENENIHKQAILNFWKFLLMVRIKKNIAVNNICDFQIHVSIKPSNIWTHE